MSAVLEHQWQTLTCEESDAIRSGKRSARAVQVQGATRTEWFPVDSLAVALIDYWSWDEPDQCWHVAPIACCSQCAETIEPDDVHAGYGMCGSCVHDALRSGWEPGE